MFFLVFVFSLQSSPELSSFFLHESSFRALLGTAYPSLKASPFCIYSLILPSFPTGQAVGERQTPTAFFCPFSHFSFPFFWKLSIFFFVLPHACLLLRTITKSVPCLLCITLVFFMLPLSHSESPAVVQTWGGGTVQPTHTCRKSEAQTHYSSRLRPV